MMGTETITRKESPYGFLYINNNSASKEAKKTLRDAKVRFLENTLESAGEPNFVAPTFITREGTFRGLGAIQAYIIDFVRGFAYQDKNNAQRN